MSDKIISRVRKMLALAGDAAASEGERDNALRMAHNILAKHNLSMAEIEATTGEAGEARGSETCETRNQPWARKASSAIGSMLFCSYFFSKSSRAGKVTHNFVGREGNAKTAAELAAFVVNSIMSEANKKWKLQADPGPWWTSFCKGAADSVWARCEEIRLTAERASSAEASTGTSLVLASLYASELAANKAFIAESMGLKLVSSKPRQKRVGDGYSAGRTFGNGISLNTQIGA
jgi:hypothetical protein